MSADRGLFQVSGSAAHLVGRRIVEVKATELSYLRSRFGSEYHSPGVDLELRLDDGSVVDITATGREAEGVNVYVEEPALSAALLD